MADKKPSSPYREANQLASALVVLGAGIVMAGLGTAAYGWGWFVGGGVAILAGGSISATELAKPTVSAALRSVDQIHRPD